MSKYLNTIKTLYAEQIHKFGKEIALSLSVSSLWKYWNNFKNKKFKTDKIQNSDLLNIKNSLNESKDYSNMILKNSIGLHKKIINLKNKALKLLSILKKDISDECDKNPELSKNENIINLNKFITELER